MGWGTRLFGFRAVSGALEDLSVEIGADAVYVVGTNVKYSIYQEFGTSRMPAQPYMRPAAEKARAQAQQIVSSGLDKGRNPPEAMALAIERFAKQEAPVDTGNLQGSIRTERVD